MAVRGERAYGINKKGYKKAINCCLIARANGFDYVWIDTCCIDKTSSAELSEAINSMYRWYEEADICYAYLADVPPKAGTGDEYRRSKWFTRGWTLQELIALSTVTFFNSEWQTVGDKLDLQQLISDITGIPCRLKMFWAARRKTTRVEDIAYCLMGMFGIYMPMLYGEGERAFIRLQEEILKVTNDQSLFAWRSTEEHGGILATSLAAFEMNPSITPIEKHQSGGF
ncbi:heterokaryon incompatibility protein-domain-containing protein [Nemania diffusa]|nr:heterokaryon incompatibility protein-domain-containing protein [Nemania diffusa]